ncbi:MAG TPA: CCA tRNA nucleotidyltransferase [Thermodesulfobacteriota bacterium]
MADRPSVSEGESPPAPSADAPPVAARTAILPESGDGAGDDLDSWGNPDGVIPRFLLDTDAVKILRRLRRHGYEAYLVGGGVRDLLLGRTPKDFDIATSARPEEVKRLFRNCRIIGRRFRLAHVFFREKIIEVSTFRAMIDPVENGNGDDLLIRNDNVFGTAEQDAVRRDFTINGLFYDVERGEVIDYVGGREDLERRIIRTIGDPDIRFREDPIRMLRAIKFAARLGFQLDPVTEAAIRRHRADILRSAPPRIMEEVLRLLGGGAARASLRLLAETGALGVLLPELQNLWALKHEGNPIAAYLWDDIEAHLAALDAFDKGRRSVSNAVLVGTLAMPLLLDRPEGLPAWSPPADLLVAGDDDEDEPDAHGPSDDGGRPARHRARHGVAADIDGIASALALRLALSRRDTEALRGALFILWRMVGQPDTRRASVLARRPAFPDALTLLRIRDLACRGELVDDLAEWERAAAAAGQMGAAGEVEPRRRRRRRGGGAVQPAPPRDPDAEWVARRSAAAEQPIPTLLIGGPAAARASIEPLPFTAGGADDLRGGGPGRKRRRRRRGRRGPGGIHGSA